MDRNNQICTENIHSIKHWGQIDNNILLQRGLRIGDQLTIFPMQGRKKSITLNRTKYSINNTSLYKCFFDNLSIKIPSFPDNRFSYNIILCPQNERTKQDEMLRYLLKSTCNIPFRINGNYSFESFVERGDKIDIGYNRLEFRTPPKIKKAKQEEILPDENIIKSDLSILIEGETGTGKSHLAKKIHEKSGRSGNFVHVNLSSFSEGLIESELFGHIKGAFTGAVCNKKGAFLTAHRGTLFLDEVDSLPLKIQTKLLLFLDSKEIRPVGCDYTECTDVRIIFASGRKLTSLVNQQKMRKDFYYRLTTGSIIQLVPLRKNSSLIVEICDMEASKHGKYIQKNLIEFYQSLSWPGNIRQLIGHIKKKIIITKGNKIIFDKSDEDLLAQSSLLKSLDEEEKLMTLSELKKMYASKLYQYFGQNINKTAMTLGITTNTLRTLIKR